MVYKFDESVRQLLMLKMKGIEHLDYVLKRLSESKSQRDELVFKKNTREEYIVHLESPNKIHFMVVTYRTVGFIISYDKEGFVKINQFDVHGRRKVKQSTLTFNQSDDEWGMRFNSRLTSKSTESLNLSLYRDSRELLDLFI